MGSELLEAASEGDVEYLKKEVESYHNNDSYFLSKDEDGMNIFHVAVMNERVEFIREGIKIIPSHLLLRLLSQPDNVMSVNPLHYTIHRAEIVREILGFYKRYKGPPLVPDNINHPLNKPWLAFDKYNTTPFHRALVYKFEESALEIMEMDMELLCNMLDKRNNSPLFLAVSRGINPVAEKILKSDFSYSLNGYERSTPLHYAPKCSEHVLILLLTKHQDLLNKIDDNGFNVLHKWVLLEKAWPLDFLLEGSFPSVSTKVFTDLIYQREKEKGDTPLHIAVRIKRINIVQSLIRGYEKYKTAKVIDYPPWKATNKEGKMPLILDLALSSNHEDIALYFLVLDPTLCQIRNDMGESPFLVAVREGCEKVVEEILKIDPNPHQTMLQRNDGSTVLHLLRPSSENLLRMLLSKFPNLIDEVDKEGSNILHRWATKSDLNWEEVGPLNLLLKGDEFPTLRTKVFRDLIHMTNNEGSTPLHIAAVYNTKFARMLIRGYQQEMETTQKGKFQLLSPPWKLEDRNGNTPLLIALSSKNEELASFFLNLDSTLLVTRNNEGEAPIVLLFAKECKQVVREVLSTYGLQLLLQCCQDDDLRSLLKMPDFINISDNKGFTILHQWAEMGEVHQLNLLLFGDFPSERTQMLRNFIIGTDEERGDNPLHIAARTNKSSDFIRALINGYKQEVTRADEKLESQDHLPWKAKNKDGDTPLHVALASNNEEVALYLLSLDPMLHEINNNKGESPLLLAITRGCGQVVKQILTIQGPRWVQICPDNVLQLLLSKFPEYIDAVDDGKEFNILHQWAELGNVWPLKFLLEGDFPTARNKIFREFIFKTDKSTGDSALHVAARENKNIDFVEALINGYQKEITSEDIPTPWKIQNKNGDTPLHSALLSKHEEISLFLLSIDPTICQCNNNKGESVLLVAVNKGCGKVVEEILKVNEHPEFNMLRRNDGVTVLHLLRFCPEETVKLLIENFWWMMNLRDDKGKTALDEAKETNLSWLINLLTNPSLVQRKPFDWIATCEKGEKSAFLAFIDTCQDVQRVFREQNDTPLHHIKFQNYNDYLDILKLPSIAELKNTTNSEGATPLHRALEDKNILLAKALLIDNGVERNIEDYHGKTAMDLLAKLCKENKDWANMCSQIKVNPYLRTTYIQPGTNVDQMRSTLSVVAALLATITFAAGFTLPGGLNSNTGDATLAKKAAFLVFLLADAYAMCTSMLVLFCLIWSMGSHRDMSYLLIDRSVLILMQSLYGTMVAFMTGIYTVIHHSSLWAAIVIIVMCCFIGTSVNRTILHKILAKVFPTANQNQIDQIRLLEEGRAFSSTERGIKKGQ